MGGVSGSLLFTAIIKVKEYLQASYRQLPLYIMATLFVMGVLQTNMAYMFFTLGCGALFGIIWVIQAILELLLKDATPERKALFMVDGKSTSCNILSSLTSLSDAGPALVTPSYYIGFIAFFATYILSNAVHLYTRTPPDVAPDADPELKKEVDAKVDNRKKHAIIIMTFVSLFTVIFLLIRLFYFKGCEKVIGVISSILIGTTVGYSWFAILNACWGNAFSDLFGITSRINVSKTDVVACVPE